MRASRMPETFWMYGTSVIRRARDPCAHVSLRLRFDAASGSCGARARRACALRRLKPLASADVALEARRRRSRRPGSTRARERGSRLGCCRGAAWPRSGRESVRAKTPDGWSRGTGASTRAVARLRLEQRTCARSSPSRTVTDELDLDTALAREPATPAAASRDAAGDVRGDAPATSRPRVGRHGNAETSTPCPIARTFRRFKERRAVDNRDRRAVHLGQRGVRLERQCVNHRTIGMRWAAGGA